MSDNIGVEYREAQILSVSGQTAWVIMEGGESVPVQVAIADYVELAEGVRSLTDAGCDWAEGGGDDAGSSFALDELSVKDGRYWAELRRKNKHDRWKLHRVHGSKIRVLHYQIPDVTDDPAYRNHHHERIILRWSYGWVEDLRTADVVFRVRVNGSNVISNRVPAGAHRSPVKKAGSFRRATPIDYIQVVITSTGDDTSKGPGGVKIGYSLA